MDIIQIAWKTHTVCTYNSNESTKPTAEKQRTKTTDNNINGCKKKLSKEHLFTPRDESVSGPENQMQMLLNKNHIWFETWKWSGFPPHSCTFDLIRTGTLYYLFGKHICYLSKKPAQD